MRKGLTELVFILDRSGSMGGLESDTIGGFNAMIEKQRKQEGEANITTVLFDDQYDVIHDRFQVEILRPMTEKEYFVRGCTALLDAMGNTIRKVENIQNYLPEEQKAEKVIFVITTDGLENASKNYTYGQIQRMVQEKKEKSGWEFLFLGANMDAVQEASRLGISAGRAVRYCNDHVGVTMNYQVVGQTLCAMRSAPKMSDVGEEWKAEIEAAGGGWRLE